MTSLDGNPKQSHFHLVLALGIGIFVGWGIGMFSDGWAAITAIMVAFLGVMGLAREPKPVAVRCEHCGGRTHAE